MPYKISTPAPRTPDTNQASKPWENHIDPTIWPTPNSSRIKVETHMRPTYNEARGSLATGKIPGPDEVPNEILKRMPERFHELLQKVFITLWNAGVTPTSWKENHTCM